MIDAIARGEPPADGPALRLAVALGLATPEGSLTEAGRAYARPALAAGPSSLVMSPERRLVAEELVGGPLPLQASLRRLLRQVISRGEPLVAPPTLGWPDALVRPYLTYLEDLGLLVPIGPLVEVTLKGRVVAGKADPACVWPPLSAEEGQHVVPHVRSAVFRYHLVRRVCLTLVARRGRREWHLLQPLLDGPLAPLVPAYHEWLARFLTAVGVARRSWTAELVVEYEATLPSPSWFESWCRTLLGVDPDGALDALTRAPGILRELPMLVDEPLTRETWVVAAAIGRGTAQGWSLKYEAAAERLAQDGIDLPPWPEMHIALEAAGLLVTGEPEARLLLPVCVQPGARELWPYAGPDWLAAALLEGNAFAMSGHARRPLRA